MIDYSPSNSDELLSISEVALIFKVHHSTIRSWIKNGNLKAVRVGQRFIRIPKREVEKFKQENPIYPSVNSVQ